MRRRLLAAALLAACRSGGSPGAYMRHEVEAHRVSLDLVEQSLNSVGNLELRATVERMRHVLEEHLQRARESLAELESSA